MSERKYLPSLGDLIDRLSIDQIKELLIPAHKEQYAQEIKDILHDIDLILQEENITVDAKIIRAIIVVSQMNLHVWNNEKNCRNGVDGPNDLRLSHGLNGLRVQAKNMLNSKFNQGQIDHKVDCLAADFKDWVVSWQ